MGSFIFGSWNAGSRAPDYMQLIRDREDATDLSPNLGKLSQEREDDKAMIQSIDRVRTKLLSETAQDLAKAADVLALQEVAGDDRPDIKVLKDKGFEIIRAPRKDGTSNTDTAIAINPNKFSDIQNRSFGEFAIAVATEKSSGQKVAFISGHIPGFNLEAEYDESAKLGDQDIKGLLKKIAASLSDCDTIFAGADMNAIMEKYQHRFDLFEDSGFNIYRSGKPTSNMSRDFQARTATLQERELDYIFVKQKPKESIFLRILKKLFSNKMTHHIRIEDLTKISSGKRNLTLDPISSPSDHIPVFVKVENVKEGVFNRIFASIKGLFS